MSVDFELDNDPVRFPYVALTASTVDKAIVVVSSFQEEGGDRKDLSLLHNGAELINEVAAHCSDGERLLSFYFHIYFTGYLTLSTPPTVTVVINSGQTVDMESWIENENVTSVIFAYYRRSSLASTLATFTGTSLC